MSDRLRLVTQPTLVLHDKGDAAIPFALGRTLAASIPNARLVTLDDANHLTLESGTAWPVSCREIVAFTGALQTSKRSATLRMCRRLPLLPRRRRLRLRSLRSPLRPTRTALFASAAAFSTVVRASSGAMERSCRSSIAFDMLVYLIEHRERAVSKDELQEAICRE